MNKTFRALRCSTFTSVAPALIGLSAAIATSGLAEDWPRWLGNSGENRTSADDRFSPDISRWKVAWKTSVGRGYSAVTIADGKAYTMGHDEKSKETVFCFDAKSGDPLWKHSYEADLMPKMHPGGPNATPTIAGDRVLVVSKDGQVFCLDAAKGAVLWKASLPAAMGVAIPSWGFASSPVVDGDRVLFGAGKVVALELATGKTIWVSKEANHPGYATVVPFESDGKKWIAALDGKGFSVLSGTDGAEITRRPFKATFDMTATTPFVLAKGKQIFISGNSSSELLAFDGKALSVVWTTTALRNAMNNSVVSDGTLYGIDGRQGDAGCRLVSVNIADGKVNWTHDHFGFGTTIGVGKTLIALTEKGELIAVKASSTGYSELGRQQVLGQTCWTPPVYANQRLYVRNDKGELVCLAVAS